MKTTFTKLKEHFMTLFEYADGRVRRDMGCNTVLSHQPNDWNKLYQRQADMFLVSKPAGHSFSGEDMRDYISKRIPAPNHHNAWSAAARSALSRWRKDGRIMDYGWSTCRSERAHARKQSVYLIVN